MTNALARTTLTFAYFPQGYRAQGSLMEKYLRAWVFLYICWDPLWLLVAVAASSYLAAVGLLEGVKRERLQGGSLIKVANELG